MSKKTIYFDADGVLLDFYPTYLWWARDNGYDMEQIGELNTYNLMSCFKEDNDFYKSLEEFRETDTYEDLPLLVNPHSLYALKNVGYRLVVITQNSSYSNNSRLRRIKNLAKFGPVFDEVIFTDRHYCKLRYIHDIAEGDSILVEDNPQVFEEYRKYPYNVKLLGIRHSYNTKEISDNSITGYYSVVELVDNLILSEKCDIARC